jgi:hypothetical protein
MRAAADAAETSAMKPRTKERKIDADALAEQIKSLTSPERSKFIDLALDANADQLSNGA